MTITATSISRASSTSPVEERREFEARDRAVAETPEGALRDGARLG